MRTRCPQCATTFRITPEQLRARGGKVRCGSCQGVFNAFDHLQQEPPAPTAPEVIPPPPVQAEVITVEFAPPPLQEATPQPAPAPAVPVAAAEMVRAPVAPPAPPAPETAPAAEPEPELEVSLAVETPTSPDEPAPVEEVTTAPVPEETVETPEQSTQAARDAGLVAVRELSETASFNRWAAGTLAGNPLAGLEAEASRRATWPFTLAALLLAIALVAQLGYHFRTELVQRLPSSAALYAALEIDVPLPRLADQVSIEASDLQSDNGRGLLILSATLKNRSASPQAWPALELTLTDSHDAVVARRVLQAADYLPPKADPAAFAAQSEIGLRLWIEAKETPAAGYRLYVFYP